MRLKESVADDRLEELMRSYWASDRMTEEAVLMVAGEDGGVATGRLLFTPLRIISVKSASLEAEYGEGRDWLCRGKELLLSAGSSIPWMTEAELHPAVPPREGSSCPRPGGGFILTDKAVLHSRRLAVTYIHSGREWGGPVPVFAGDRLPCTIGRLKGGQPVSVALYGDSISAGYDCSSMLELPPYQPAWGRLLAEWLRHIYPGGVQLHNPSVGGKSADWGLDHVEELVANERRDLVILGFGMNDGTGRVPPKQFGERILNMMTCIRRRWPDTEFILIAPMLPNPLAALPDEPEKSFFGEQLNYKPVLEELAAAPGCALLDMTSVHGWLLQHKAYWDMTGNQTNHPNDFLSRWYAQTAAALLAE
ncbi:SGNH/GDSL hydrolase family protein [Paenibacillus sp. YN15]|uniref:SGNH/GDSL hydrolase family protein n=1 Tax=Paenibacillus sp. YN15 TaxID=1742774 RepID=UPI000DCE3007|nr:SGNH/GDSL hydrolase family protein [Paenibacillus sp. YN15]RAV05584.1 SGNH/GDSL hydrolase family protein [Paenibacillus sp. YN15]